MMAPLNLIFNVPIVSNINSVHCFLPYFLHFMLTDFKKLFQNIRSNVQILICTVGINLCTFVDFIHYELPQKAAKLSVKFWFLYHQVINTHQIGFKTSYLHFNIATVILENHFKWSHTLQLLFCVTTVTDINTVNPFLPHFLQSLLTDCIKLCFKTSATLWIW